MADKNKTNNPNDPGSVLPTMSGGGKKDEKDNWWKKFGIDYDSINKSLGGLPEWIRGQAEYWDSTQAAREHPVLGAIEAGATGLRDTLTGGLAPAILGRLAPSVQQGAEEVASTYPIATGIGKGAGLAGATLLMPSAAAPGVADAVPAAGKAGSAVAAEKLIPTFARNALTSAAMQAPSSMAQAVRGDSPEQIAKEAAINVGLGAVAGTASEMAVPALVKGYERVKKLLVDQHLKSSGISGRDLKSVLNPRFTSREGIAQAKSDLSYALSKAGATGEKSREALADQVSSIFEAGRKAWDDTGFVPSALTTQILDHPKITQMLETYPEGLDILSDILQRADKQKDAAAVREYLYTLEQLGRKSGDELVAAKGALAGHVRDVFDDKLGELAAVNMGAAKREYKTLLPMIRSLKREELNPREWFTAGSPTAEKLEIMKKLGGIGAGGALGGGTIAAREVLGGNKDLSDPGTLATIGGGALLGGVASRVLPKAANAATGTLAGKVASGMNPEALTRAAQPLSQAMQAAAPRVAQFVTGMEGAAKRESMVPETPPIVTPATQLDMTPSTDAALQVAAAPTPLTPKPKDTAIPKAAQAVAAREGQVSQAAIDGAKKSADQIYADKITQRVKDLWDRTPDPKPDFETFMKQARYSTNDFDPKSEKTAKVIMGKDYKDYLRTYNAYLALHSLGEDLGNAIQFSKVDEMQATLGLSPTASAKREQRDRLIQGIYVAMTGKTEEPDAKTKKQIDDKLFDLMKSQGDPGQKKARLFDMLEKQYGYRADVLREYGLSEE
ncbi:MAG: hypothetical protein WC455_16025 [Dehalococcoidia bacterium]|jgi:hypothetical protein